MSDWLKVVAFSCTHHPLADEDTTKWRLSEIKQFKPDVVVNLGDWMDADAASRWPNEHQWTLADEYRAVASDAIAVRSAAPSAKLVWLHGNHDDNLTSPNRIPIKLRDVCSWKNDKGLAQVLKGWTIIPYTHRSYYRIGQVTFQHGAQTNVNADRDQSLLYGVENGLWVGGHTHRPQQITRVVLPGKIPLNRYFCNVGCGMDWEKMEYVRRSNIATWGHGIVKLLVNPRRSAFASVQWEGVDSGIKIHKMVS
jgi:predicted phosphodiesterase